MTGGTPTHPDVERSRLTQRIAWLALIGGVVIMGLKIGVFLLTDSAAVLTDALESLVNIAAAALAVFSTWYASQPADRKHPYGHGNIEFISAGVEGTLVAVAGVIILVEGIRRLALGVEPDRLDLGMLALAGINVLLFGLAFVILRAGEKHDSPTLRADGKHLLIDVGTTFTVILALALVRLTGIGWLDPAAAIVMAGVIVFLGLRLVRESLSGIMDERDLAEDAKLRAILDQAVHDEEILSYHKLRHRHVGAFHWVEFHLHLPGEMSVRDAHTIASEIEHRIETMLGRADATAHIEPPEAAEMAG